jgi:asparaginyl-tRNA synthetase
MRQIAEVLDKKYDSKKVKLRGWIYRKRDQKKMIFLIIRDSSDIIQAVIKEDSKAWTQAKKATIESSIVVEGTLKQDKRAPTGYELQVSKLDIIGLAERFPIARDKSTEFLMDIRHLWLRSRELSAALKVRSKVTGAIHEYFRSKDYYEFQSPVITATKGEGGSDVFELKYFKEKAYLTQTWQLYAEAGIMALEKMYCIAPTFRAEKSFTSRHLTEFWMSEVETAWQDFDEMLKQIEDVISFIAQKVAKECKKELKVLGKDPKELLKIKPPFPRLKYKDAVKKLQKKGFKVKYGDDIGTKEEKSLADMYDLPVIVTHYPKGIKAFYMKEDPKDPKQVLACDVMCKDVGETVGGSAREEDIKKLKIQLKASGEKIKDYEWYLDLRRYGSVPHCGFGIGTERLIRFLTGIEHIRDAIPFPRTPSRIRP